MNESKHKKFKVEFYYLTIECFYFIPKICFEQVSIANLIAVRSTCCQELM